MARALAHVTGHHCQLVSRNGHPFKSWPYLAEEIAHAVRAHGAVPSSRRHESELERLRSSEQLKIPDSWLKR